MKGRVVDIRQRERKLKWVKEKACRAGVRAQLILENTNQECYQCIKLHDFYNAA